MRRNKEQPNNVSELSKQLLDQLLGLYRLCWKEMRTYDYDDATGIVLDIEDVKTMDEYCAEVERILQKIKEIAPDKVNCTCLIVRQKDCPFHRDR